MRQELLTITDKYQQLRENGGYKVHDNIRLIKVTGADAASYINTQTTNETITLETNKGIANNLVDRKAHLKAHFTIHCLHDELFILAEKVQSEILEEHLENFHFTEDFSMENITDKFDFISVVGNISTTIIEEITGIKLAATENYDILKTDYHKKDLYLIYNNEIGEAGFLCIIEKEEFENFKKAIVELSKNYNLIEIDDTLSKILRVEAGIPKYGIDINGENLLPETGLEKFSVSYSKGCYLGQEVIARIKTYGTVPKALIGMIFEDDQYPDFDNEIVVNTNKNIGTIKSTVFSPYLNKNIAMVYLHKDYRKPDETIEFQSNGKSYHGTVKLLPFYQPMSNEQKAKYLYDKALTVFAENNEEEAVLLLKDAITKKPDFADAYESLGVILSRLERYEEAIEVMTKLTEVNPDEPMARTNLSIFYMKIGNKEEAETQMARATAIKFTLAMKESKNKKAIEAKKKEEIEAIKERMEMFIEVLETEDPDDLIANYGLGKSYFDLEQYSQAIPCFRKAIEVKKDYSMAYLYLGKSLEFTDQKEEAKEVYKNGIVAASQKGDLMPLKEMEQRKLALHT